MLFDDLFHKILDDLFLDPLRFNCHQKDYTEINCLQSITNKTKSRRGTPFTSFHIKLIPAATKIIYCHWVKPVDRFKAVWAPVAGIIWAKGSSRLHNGRHAIFNPSVLIK